MTCKKQGKRPRSLGVTSNWFNTPIQPTSMGAPRPSPALGVIAQFAMHYPLIAVSMLAIEAAAAPAPPAVNNSAPRSGEPVLRVFSPDPSNQTKAGVGKFVIFTREQLGTGRDYVAGAWECIPSRAETPLTKRVEFCSSSWNADALLNGSVSDESIGMHPRFVRLQVDGGDGDLAVNLYDINYRTWEVRLLRQDRRLIGFGSIGNSIFCRSSNSWLLLDAASGEIDARVPFVPVGTDGNYWLVRKPGETDGAWSYNVITRQFIAHFGPVAIPEMGYTRSVLSPDGNSRAWVVFPMPRGWRGGALEGELVLQRQGGGGDISVPIEMEARPGSGRPVLPRDIDLSFTPDGQVRFRARKGRMDPDDQVWSIDVASGDVSSRVEPHRPSSGRSAAILNGVQVPDYLQKYVSEFRLTGRSDLAVAFLLHLGMLEDRPEFSDYTAGVSRDGRHVLFAAKKGPLSGYYVYGNILTKETVRWRYPGGLDPRFPQAFVWVETPD